MRHTVTAHRVTGRRRLAFQVKGQLLSEPGRGSKVSMQTPSAVSLPAGRERLPGTKKTVFRSNQSSSIKPLLLPLKLFPLDGSVNSDFIPLERVSLGHLTE